MPFRSNNELILFENVLKYNGFTKLKNCPILQLYLIQNVFMFFLYTQYCSMAFHIQHVHHIMAAVFCACAIGHGFLLPHAEVTDPLQNIYRGYRNTGRGTRASWLVTRNAYIPGGTSKYHWRNPSSIFPAVHGKRSYARNQVTEYPETTNPELYLGQGSLSNIRRRRNAGEKNAKIQFTQKVQRLPNTASPTSLEGQNMFSGGRDFADTWMPLWASEPFVQGGQPNAPQITNRAIWLQSRANWLPNKRVPSNDGNDISKPDERASWLPFKKDTAGVSKAPQRMAVDTRASWLPSKKNVDESQPANEDSQSVEIRASWLPSKRMEYPDGEVIESSQAEGKRASWLIAKKDNEQDLPDTEKDIPVDKKALWLPNKRQGPSQQNQDVQTRAAWLHMKKKSDTKGHDQLEDEVDEQLKQVSKAELDEIIETTGKSKPIKRQQRSVSRVSSHHTESPMGHFINGRSYEMYKRQDNDNHGFLLASQAKGIDPLYLDLYKDIVNDIDDDSYPDDSDPWITQKRIPTSRAVSDHEKMSLDVHSKRAMWLPMRGLVEKRIPTERSIYDSDSYEKDWQGILPGDGYYKRIPTQRDLVHHLSDKHRYNYDMHKRIPTERSWYSGGTTSLYGNERYPYRKQQQSKRIPTERDLYSGVLSEEE